jgi:hypothetical protein
MTMRAIEWQMAPTKKFLKKQKLRELLDDGTKRNSFLTRNDLKNKENTKSLRPSSESWGNSRVEPIHLVVICQLLSMQCAIPGCSPLIFAKSRERKYPLFAAFLDGMVLFDFTLNVSSLMDHCQIAEPMRKLTQLSYICIKMWTLCLQ